MCILATLIWAFIAHGYYFTSHAFSHDSLMVASFQNQEWQISLGRYLMPVYRYFRGNISTPWLIGICAILFCAASVWLIVDMFQVYNKTYTILIAGIMMVNPVVIAQTATYIPWLDIYMCSLFFAVFSIWCLQKFSWYRAIIAVLSLSISMALYGSYITVTVVLAMFYIMHLNYNKVSLSQMGIKILQMLAVVIAGAVLYFMVFKIVLYATDIAVAASYNSIESAGDFSDVSVWSLLKRAWHIFFYRLSVGRNTHPGLVQVLYILLGVCFVVQSILCNMQTKHKALSVLYSTLVFLSLPWVTNSMFILSGGNVSHMLVQYAMYFIGIAGILFLHWQTETGSKALYVLQRALKVTSIVSICIVLWSFTVWGNGLYLKKRLAADRTDQFMARALEHIEAYPGYVAGETPVVFTGNFLKSSAQGEVGQFDGMYNKATGFSSDTSLTHRNSYMNYFKYKSINIKLLENEEWYAYSEREDVQAMPIFPQKDSLQMIDGVLVVN